MEDITAKIQEILFDKLKEMAEIKSEDCENCKYPEFCMVCIEKR